MKKLIDMQYTLKFGRFKGCTIQAMLDERDHECVNYLLWLQRELKFEYTQEVQEELRWQDEYVPKHSYNKYSYWGYTLKY